MELVPSYVSDSDMKDEVNRRTHRAGYTDRDGQPLDPPKIRSKVTSEAYRRNFDNIFRKGKGC